MYSQPSFIKRKIRSLALKIFNKLENNGNTDFTTNGEERFINALWKTFRQRQQKVTVFDIGANVGEYAQMILSKAAQQDLSLHLFEPTQSCLSQLNKQFQTNDLVTINPFGASDTASTATIYYDKEQSGLASLYQRNLTQYNLSLGLQEEIQLRRLDTYIEEQKITHIDLLKIDIEGHELKAFEGLGKYLDGDFIDYIQFEYGGANLDAHSSLLEFYTLLQQRGFVIAKIMPNGLDIRDYSSFMENFYYANYVAISQRVLKAS